MTKQELLTIINDNNLSEEEKINKFQAIVKSEDDLINLNDDQECLLHIAAERGYYVICQWLIQHYPILLETKNVRGSNVLFFAASSHNESLFKFLVSCRPSLLHEVNRLKRHILFALAHDGLLNLLIELKDQLPQEWLITKDNDNSYPISWAAHQGHTDIVLWILKQLQDQPDVCKQQFMEAATVAAIGDKVELIMALQDLHSLWLNTPNNLGYTPFQAAVRYGRLATATYLLQQFPAALQELYKNKVRISDLAARSGSLSMMKTIADLLPPYDFSMLLQQPNLAGYYILFYAVKSGSADLVEHLLRMGANPYQKSMREYGSYARNLPIHIAAMHGDEKVLAVLNHYGVDIDAYSDDGLTPLHLAIMNGHNNTVTWLLEQGASVSKPTLNSYENRAIHIAAISGRYNLLDQLVAYGAKLDQPNGKGMYISHLAAASVYDITVDYVGKMLLNACKKAGETIETKIEFKVDKWSNDLMTYFVNLFINRGEEDFGKPHLSRLFPQHVSILDDRNYCKVLGWLVHKKINIGQLTEDSYKNNACHMAAQTGQLENLIYLSEHLVPINCANAEGYFPIHLAAQYGHQHVVKWLLQQGALVEQSTANEKPNTPLTLAIKHNHLAVLDVLKEYQVNINHSNDGVFPLAFAFIEDYPDTVKWLLQNGATIDHALLDNFHAFQLAAYFDSANCLEILSDLPMKYWEQQDEYCHTPLTVALANNSIKFLKALITLQPELDKKIVAIKPLWQGIWAEKTSYGWYPIHYLSLLKMPKTPDVLDLSALEEIIEYLDCNALTEDNNTVLHLLIKRIIEQFTYSAPNQYDNYLRIISLLLKHGLNPHIRDKEGLTAFDYIIINMRSNKTDVPFTLASSLLLYVFKEYGIDVDAQVIEETFVFLPQMDKSRIDDFLEFVLNYFPQLYSKAIDIVSNLNLLVEILKNNNIIEQGKLAVYIKHGLLNGHSFNTSQVNILNSIITREISLAYLAIDLSIFTETEEKIKLTGFAITDIQSLDTTKIEVAHRIFLLKQLCAFIITSPTIFTDDMRQHTINIFEKMALATACQDVLNIVIILLDKGVANDVLSNNEERLFRKLYFQLYQQVYKAMPSLLEMSVDAVVRLPRNVFLDEESKKYLTKQLTLIGSGFGRGNKRIQTNKEFIFKKFETLRCENTVEANFDGDKNAYKQ